MGVEEKSTHTHIKKQRERRTECWEFERGFCLLFRNIHSLPILISFLSIYLFFSYYFLTFQFSLSLLSQIFFKLGFLPKFQFQFQFRCFSQIFPMADSIATSPAPASLPRDLTKKKRVNFAILLHSVCFPRKFLKIFLWHFVVSVRSDCQIFGFFFFFHRRTRNWSRASSMFGVNNGFLKVRLAFYLFVFWISWCF